MKKAKEYGATSYMHLHIIPTANTDLKNVNTAAGKLDGSALHDTWTSLLKSPDQYKAVDPKDFISAAKKCEDTLAWTTYLQNRYWD
jgi:hypothetical protein